MRILSSKLIMTSSFTHEDFYRIIVKWLKESGPCKPVGEMLESVEDPSNANIEAKFCKVDTFTTERGASVYWLFNLTHEFHEQTWDTEVIYECGEQKTVYFHIDCSRDVTKFSETPEIRSEVIRTFLRSGYVDTTVVPLSETPYKCEGEAETLLIQAIRGDLESDLPVVMISNYFNSMGGDVDEDTLAKKLSGLAYVVVCNNEDTRYVESKAGKRCPYNGSIAIYMSGGKPRILRKEDAFHGMSLDQLVVNEVQRFVTARVDATAPTFKQMLMEQIRADAQEKKELLDVAIDENMSLEEQLKQAKKKMTELANENRRLNARASTLEAALQSTESDGLLIKAPITEFFEGEQHDLLITLLTKALANYTEDTRAYELVRKILEVNVEKGNGRVIIEVVKSVLSNGGAPRESDFNKLRAVGFEVLSEQNHYKVVFKGNDKYWFTIFKTPSDHRGGKNLVSDILKRISIYR